MTRKSCPLSAFVRGLVDSADLPLSLSREMIQKSPVLAAIKKSVTGRVLGDWKSSRQRREAYGKIWDVFGAVIKEGIYEDYERRIRCSSSRVSAAPRRLRCAEASRTMSRR